MTSGMYAPLGATIILVVSIWLMYGWGAGVLAIPACLNAWAFGTLRERWGND